MVGNIPEFQKLKIGHPYEWSYLKLVGGFKYFLFSPLPGEMIKFDEYFSDGLKPPTSKHRHKFPEFLGDPMLCSFQV